MKKTEARYIKAETIRIGDLIRVTWMDRDVNRFIEGKVARREHFGQLTEWMTADGIVLVSREGIGQPTAGGLLYPMPARITLLQAAPELDTLVSLF